MRLDCFYSWAVLACLCFVPIDKLCESLEIRVPVNYTALSGDLEVHILDVSARYTRLQLLEFTAGGGWALMGSVPLPAQAPVNTSDSYTYQVVEVKFPCGVITQGGKYGVRLAIDRGDLIESNSVLSADEPSTELSSFSTARFSNGDDISLDEAQVIELDVRWPGASLTLEPRLIQTYPELTVTASLMFQSAHCEPALGTLVPETWLDLLYCGHSPIGCTHANSTHRQLLYSEQVRGYPQLRVIKLECNLFGLAGHYALALRTDMHFPGPVIAGSREDAALKAEWSEKFVFNVHARSIFPCDAHGGGVPVLFQYPSCILPTGDKVRVFARQRADVSALVPPSLLEYVTEQKIAKGKHSLHFDCDLFSEKYVEYCFVYVSQALTGAVSDVRMDCVPTLPVSEADSGQWGPWSEWTPCSTTCLGGTRNRYRFCDNPPPRYGAKFCEGHALETERCGSKTGWECQLFTGQGLSPELPADRAEIRAEIGPGCRCGCVIHLGVGKPRRLLASSSQSCPGRTFWLVQADRTHIVKLTLEHFRLACPSQWLKIRDGDSLSSKLLAVLSGTPLHLGPILTTGPYLLIEFFSDEMVAAGEECWGGFLAHAEQIDPKITLASHSASVSIMPRVKNSLTELNLSHLLAATLLAVVTTASLCLLVQYLRRYSKYQRAAAIEDMVTDHSEGDESGVCGGDSRGGAMGGGGGARLRAASTSTLLSEVISLHRLPRTNKHKRLEEDDTEIDDQFATKLHKRSNKDDKSKRVVTVELNYSKKYQSTPFMRRKHNRSTADCEKEYSETSVDEDTSPPGAAFKTSKSVDYQISEKINKKMLSPSIHRQLHKPSSNLSSNSSLKNCSKIQETDISPSSSVSRSDSKARKDRKNWERMMMAGSSELSLTGGDTDLEMDYYDYNVQNASAVPGSYLGMDPAFCVWIPPFAPGKWSENTELLELQPVSDRDSIADSELTACPSQSDSSSLKAVKITRSSQSDIASTTVTPEPPRGRDERRVKEKDAKGSFLCDKLVPVSPARVHQAFIVKEKETKFEKSPSDKLIACEADGEDEIKFADEEEDEEELEECQELIKKPDSKEFPVSTRINRNVCT